MVTLSYLIDIKTASKFLHLAFDYDLPMEIDLSEMIIIPQRENRRKSTLCKTIVSLDESDMELLDAALLILGIS